MKKRCLWAKVLLRHHTPGAECIALRDVGAAESYARKVVPFLPGARVLSRVPSQIISSERIAYENFSEDSPYLPHGPEQPAPQSEMLAPAPPETLSGPGILVPEFNFSAGTERVVLRITESWVTAGRRVVLAAPAHRLRHYESSGLNPKVDRVPFLWPRRGWQRVLRFFQRSGRGPAVVQNKLLAWRMRHLANRYRCTVAFVPWIFDVPHISLPVPFGALAMDLAWHHFPTDAYSPRSREVVDRRFLNWLERASAYFPVSNATAEEIARAFPQCRTPNVAIPHGADIVDLPPRPASPDKSLFIYPAGFSINKSHLLLLQAAKSLLESGLAFRLAFTGHGTSLITQPNQSAPVALRHVQDFYRRNANLFDGHIEAHGFTDRGSLEQLYASARRVLLPSAYEGFGLPLLEAFARGATVICSDIPPFREQIARYGMSDRVAIASAPTAEVWAKAIKTAIEQPPPPPLAARELHTRLARWSWSDAANAYLQELDKLTDSAVNSPPPSRPGKRFSTFRRG